MTARAGVRAAAPLLRVCVTGPESTGKTSLAAHLAEQWGTIWVPEASRAHAERNPSRLLLADVLPIAREHVTLADDAASRATKLLVLDTDLLSTVVYSRHYYGVVPPELDALETAHRADLYLLCDVDVPWVPDGIRDRPVDRESMLDAFCQALEWRKLRWTMIRGDWNARWRAARGTVENLVAAPPRVRTRSSPSP